MDLVDDLVDEFVSRTFCKSFAIDGKGRMYVLTEFALFCFSENDYSYLHCHLLNENDSEVKFDRITISNPSSTKRYIVLCDYSINSDTFFEYEKSPTSICLDKADNVSSFTVFNTDGDISKTAFETIGVFPQEMFAEYGRIVYISVSDDCLHLFTETNKNAYRLLFYPETGKIKEADNTDNIFVFSFHKLSGFGKILNISEQAVDNITFIRVKGLFPIQSYASLSKSFFSILDYFNSNTLKIFQLEYLSNGNASTPLIARKFDSPSRNGVYIINNLKSNFFAIEKGKDFVEYDINSHTMIRDKTGCKAPSNLIGYDEISFSLIGTEKYHYSKRYFKAIDYHEFDWQSNQNNDCFHNLYNRSFSVGGNTNLKLLGFLLRLVAKNKGQLAENFRRKFQTAVFAKKESLKVVHMLCIYHRFILAIGEKEFSSEIVFLVLDLKTNKLTRIDTNLPVDSENRNDYESHFIWGDSGEEFDGFNLNHIFYLAKDTLYELSLNLENRDCTVIHEVMLFPSVELLDCKFDGTEVVLSTAREKELKSIEAEKKKILDSWKENVIVSSDKE